MSSAKVEEGVLRETGIRGQVSFHVIFSVPHQSKRPDPLSSIPDPLSSIPLVCGIFPVLRCAVVTARCSYVASLASGFHALRSRRNPAAGPVIAAPFVHLLTEAKPSGHSSQPLEHWLIKKCPHGYRQILATPTCGQIVHL